jgi:hypothetical protein
MAQRQRRSRLCRRKRKNRLAPPAEAVHARKAISAVR